MPSTKEIKGRMKSVSDTHAHGESCDDESYSYNRIHTVHYLLF